MKYTLYFILLLFINCTSTVTEKDLQFLNGYWEIEKVVSAKNKTTQYGINATIDFYFIDNNNIGYRKKTTPDFSGKYKVNNIKDSIRISKKNKQFVIHTSTALASWDDIIIKLTSKELVLENEKGARFHYKKYQKLNL